jgi:acetyl esterase/lipase
MTTNAKLLLGLAVVLLIGGLFYFSISESAVSCEVCIEFRGGTECRKASGKDADEALARNLSNEQQVTAQTPPTFIFQTDADKGVPAENCVSFYLALRRAGVPADLHVYQDGKHGVGLAQDVPATSSWPDRLRDWMHIRGLLSPNAN